MPNFDDKMSKARPDSGLAPDVQRASAVAAALEVIHSRAPSADAVGVLKYDFDHLSDYADRIQEALKKID